MKFSHTLSAIIREPWLVDPAFAESQLPFISRLLSGEKMEQDYARPEPVSYQIIQSNEKTTVKVKDLADAPQGSVMKITMQGAILKYGDWCSYGTMDYIDFIDQANSSENIAAILMVVDSPGGQASGIELLREAIASSSKPVYAFIQGTCASAALYSIASASKIYAASEACVIGSLGGMISLRDYSEYFKKMGITERTVYAPQSTAKNIEARELMDKNNEKPMKAHLGQLIDIHHAAVRSYRPLQEVEGLSWEDGSIHFSAAAESLGLIDGIKTLSDLLAEINSNIQIPQNSMFNKLPKLTALAGVPAADLTEEQILAVNAELDEKNLSALRVVPASFVAKADAAVAAKNQAEADLKTVKAELATAKDELETAKAEIVRLGDQPGATPSAVVNPKETQEEPKAAGYMSETDRLVAEAKGKIFHAVN